MFLVQVMMEDMPIVVEQFLYRDEDNARVKVQSLINGGEDEYNVRMSRIEIQDARDVLRTPKPVFNSSELLSIHEIASLFDKSKPGYVDVDDIEPIKEKIKEWFKRVVPGRELR